MKLLLLLLTAAICFAQTEEKKPEPPKYYRADFVVKEVEAGRVISSRSYAMNLQAPGRGSIRTGDKVPVSTGKDGATTYLDVGMNVDCSMDPPVQDRIRMHITADISNIASEKPGLPPLINSTRSITDVVVPLRKETNIFSADGTTTKRQMQMDVTVTPIP